jgi:hypothetical protein
MALMLIVASLQNDEKFIQKTLGKIDYHLRRNATVYKSHSSKKS